jgi:hypothetical protein
MNEILVLKFPTKKNVSLVNSTSRSGRQEKMRLTHLLICCYLKEHRLADR